MFLNLLKPEEKSAFLTLAKRVIAADQVIAAKEMVMLESMKKELEINDDQVEDLDEDLSSLCGKV